MIRDPIALLTRMADEAQAAANYALLRFARQEELFYLARRDVLDEAKARLRNEEPVTPDRYHPDAARMAGLCPRAREVTFEMLPAHNRRAGDAPMEGGAAR